VFCIPPPASAELSEKVQLETVGEEELLYIPPPVDQGLPLPAVTLKPSIIAPVKPITT